MHSIAATVTFAPTAVVAAVTFVGFNSGGILADSLAVKFMDGYGGTVGGGYPCAVLKSIRAKGAFSAAGSDAARAAAGVVTCTIAVLAGRGKKEQSSDKDEGHSGRGRERDDASYHDSKSDNSDGEGMKADSEEV
ncbi:hypothetical protein BGZ99_001009 [Dissophora globulifera]|uniref:Uncharacterized protein n=1 Tax=Dissophora globulifera TaxID=979702 RepID=A0A9P6UKX4_9FUNG|nr:hypothetical protein BGZ99_001009 [Dissophora globulifera]